VPCESTVHCLRNEDGEAIGVIGTTRDVAERKRMEQALIRSERLAAVGTLTAGVAHEFNNLNSIILGMAELALRDCGPQPALVKKLTTIRQAAMKGCAVVNNLLSLGAREPHDLRPGNLSRAVEDALSLVEDELSREGITLVRNLPSVPDSLMNEGQITQVILNLLTNARHALLDRPIRGIQVETGTALAGIYVKVSDTGCGIPSSHLPRIFTPFFSTKGEHGRGETPQSRVRGTGLGLGVSHTIVSNHGGTFTVQSQEGVGTTFTINLPLPVAERTELAPERPRPLP
jgi:two-component system, NtrC family, sensor kinase